MNLSLIADTDKRLTQLSESVTVFDSELQNFTEALKNKMIESKGCGIAAPQVGVLKRIIVVESKENEFTIMINPRIITSGGESTNSEGCLSFPNVFVDITRNSHISVEYQNVIGETFTWELDDFTAIIIQHEIDHLDGIVMKDHVSRLKWERAVKKSKKP